MIQLFRRDDIPGGDYMRRWKIFYTRLFQVRLHHTMRADSDRHCYHDHPFSFLSIRLKGNYVERRPGDHHRSTRPHWTRGRVIYRAAETLHRIDWVSPGGCWTLVIAGPERRAWGFIAEWSWASNEDIKAGIRELPGHRHE